MDGLNKIKKLLQATYYKSVTKILTIQSEKALLFVKIYLEAMRMSLEITTLLFKSIKECKNLFTQI